MSVRAGGMALRIVGDRGSNAIIVRADDDEFLQIFALAEALQQTAHTNGLSVRVLPLSDAPAARVAEAVQRAFATKAKQERLPLSIQIDAVGNALIIASTRPMFEEIKAVVVEMDRLAPTAGQGIFLIQLENVPAVRGGKEPFDNLASTSRSQPGHRQGSWLNRSRSRGLTLATRS